MTCKGCGYNWCWLCEGRYHENHYMRGGSCYGMQFDTNSTLHNACFRKIVVFWRILFDILKLVFFILLFTLFGIPCASIYLFNKIFYSFVSGSSISNSISHGSAAALHSSSLPRSNKFVCMRTRRSTLV